MADNWQNKLKDSFESYTEPAPEGLWAAVSTGVVSARAAQRKRRRIRAFSYAAAAFASLAALAFILFSPLGERASEPADGDIRLLAFTDPGEPRLMAAVLPEPKALKAEARPRIVKAEAVEPQIAAAQTASPASSPAAEAPTPAPEETAVSAAVPSAAPVEAEAVNAAEWTEEEKVQQSGLSLNLQLSNALAQYSSTGQPVQYMDLMLDSGKYVLVSSRGDFADIRDDMRHYQPISFGLSLSWDISRYLSLESGISYSLLYSDYRPENQASGLELRQSIHYLGIPLNLRYDFLKGDRFALYLSGGAMAQKAIYGSTDMFFRQSGGETREDRIKIDERQLQFSLNASLGASYALTPGISLYFQPGLSYHFDNGGKVVNIYKKRPLNFSVSLGLRLDIAH